MVGLACLKPVVVFTLLFRCVAAWNVTFLACMSYTSLAYSYDYYGPAIDMALVDLRKIYPEIGFTKTSLSPKEVHSCPELDGRILDLITDYLYSNELGIAQWKDPTNLIVIIVNGRWPVATICFTKFPVSSEEVISIPLQGAAILCVTSEIWQGVSATRVIVSSFRGLVQFLRKGLR
jgi:hypothetical protein